MRSGPRRLWTAAESLSTVLTFLCVLQPLNKFLHLLEEDAPPFGEVAVRVPLQYGLLTQDISCGGREGKSRKGRQQKERPANFTVVFTACGQEKSTGFGGNHCIAGALLSKGVQNLDG